ncbi:MAG: RluA family pseudouridine synthase [Crocinitomicaceae bacterium]|nr:RluA family pseudouridine synthase [Crocinitomicaceae bacterium]
MIVLEQHRVTDNSKERRFIEYCIGLFPQIQSKNAVKKAIKREELLLNGEVGRTGTWVSEGDDIQLVEGIRKAPKPFPMAIDIVFEDDHITVVNKPSGLVVSGNKFQTLENALVDQVQLSKAPDALEWVKPVHRLDGPTSGLVLCAKTYSARINLMRQFEGRTVDKLYHAVLMGKCSKSEVIDSPIEDQECLSELEPIRCVKSLRSGHMTLVQLKPKTGRTHQLRIHCQSIGHPIVGDTQYGDEGNVLLHKGLFLAATSIAFIHPVSGVRTSFTLDIPSKFKSLMERESRRYDKYHSIT